MAKKILITGGAGFVGYHLAKHLLASGEVLLTFVDNLQRGRMDADFKSLLEDNRVTFIEADLTDPASYEKLGNSYEHVYHLAAINGTKLFYKMPEEVLRINTLSLIYILEWFRRENAGGKILFTSSNEAYAGGLNAFGVLPIPTPEDVPLVIEDPYNARWSYAATKLIGELFLIHYAAKYKLRSVIVRPHNFYGPRAGYDHVIPEFSARISSKTDPFSIFGADETRTFCYIGDAVSAMQQLMDSPKTDGLPIETLHIGAEEEITMRELAEKMFSITDWRPKALDIKTAPEGSVKRRKADISKIYSLIGWKPETPLDDGLRRTHEWYVAHPKS